MAFGGILVANFLFIILLIIFILFVISLINFIIFTILSLINKTKKARKILKIVFGILTLIFLTPLVFVMILLHGSNEDTIEYNGKKYKVNSELVNKFQSEISYCDTDELDKYLKENPELINSRDFEGSLPLGNSIKYKKLECIKYFLNKNSDINNVSSNTEYGTLEYMFYYDYYDEEILNYLLSRDDLDVNKRHLAMPVAQLYIKNIIKDKEISDIELELFEKLLDKGLDLNQTNGTETNTFDYVYEKSDDIVNIDKLRAIIDNRK